MKIVLCISIILYIVGFLFDITYMDTHNILLKYASWASVFLANLGTFYYLIKNIKANKKSEQDDFEEG